MNEKKTNVTAKEAGPVLDLAIDVIEDQLWLNNYGFDKIEVRINFDDGHIHSITAHSPKDGRSKKRNVND